jgi:methylmalonyl-CoA mutase
MSAAIGGCDSLTVEPFGFDEHLALNSQRILAEEAYLNVVADPAGGCYYIEALTSSLAREAWKFFQRIEASGGYSAALKANWLGEEIANSRASREKAIAFRCQTMVGVNNYPNLAEKGMAKAQLLNELEAPFPISRVAEPFEAIRERTTCHSIQTGCTPKVLVLKRGDLKMRNARANFARNFFGCAGFDIAESEDHTGAVADLIVLCSSDAEYLPFAQEVCAAVRSPVIVAGNPKDQIKELEATGVRGFIHSGSNAVEVLAHWQKRLGVTGEEA